MDGLREWMERRWYGASAPLALRPLSALYGWISRRRRRQLSASPQPLPVPVVVVGNISVGGTGKTPLVIYLIERLRAWGFQPGVIARGYGGKADHYPLFVGAQTSAELAGDEPTLVAQRTGAPVFVSPDRLAAARALLAAKPEVDLIISDDGLQHYRLARDVEICVVDGARGLGNGALLPAGPLREPRSRLDEVALLAINGDGFTHHHPHQIRYQRRIQHAIHLVDQTKSDLSDLSGQRVHAVAGIGKPAAFFDALRAFGIELIEHAFADHHRFSESDLRFDDALPVLMTEKDAVKCAGFDLNRLHAVPLEIALDPSAERRVRELIEPLRQKG